MLAIAIGGASFVNATPGHALRYACALVLVSAKHLRRVDCVHRGRGLGSGHPPLWMLMTYLMVAFFGVGLLFGNLNTLAMEPLGHIAGTGAAVVGATSMLISLVLGTSIGQSYNGTVLPWSWVSPC